jgi:hypothetical protein
VADRQEQEEPKVEVEAQSSPQPAMFSNKAKRLRAAPGAAAGGVLGGVPPVSMGALTLSSEPVHTLQFLDNGSARVTVNSPSGGNVYLVKRSPDKAVVIRSLRSVTGPSGTTQADFEFTLSPSDFIDLYIVSKPVPDPADLPMGNVPDGYYRRIYPRAQTNQPK